MGPETDRKGERALIRRIARMGRPASVRLPLDDMNAIPGGAGLLWSTDMLMDGVDFRSGEHSWRQIGRKAMAVNLSDCAAMAARPLGAVCAVCLCDELTMDDAVELHEGVRGMGLEFECPLTGGDTNSWRRPTVISVTVAATTPADRVPIGRAGARAGDLICLTGAVGGSILGRHLSFRPRVNEALAIAERLSPTAMIDISDGLAVDLHQLCEASACGALIDESRLEPMVHPDATALSGRTGKPALEHALFDGEDFELIVALPPDAPAEVIEALGLARIGVFSEAAGVQLRHADGSLADVPARGWEHFQ